MQKIVRLAVLFSAVCFAFFPATAQSLASDAAVQAPSPPPKRPRIGLVLSGGGARGLAHIGVLEWFEAHRIPVDYVSGTSMGGLVGGMYSMGMSPSEMRAFMKGINWKETLGEGPTYEQSAFRRKEDRNTYQVGFELGLRNGVNLPTGLSSAHYIGLLIDRVTLPYSTVENFDELPIPYRCVATDFLKAQPVTLRSGPLSTAMRATMSIPGLFPPVERDGKVLVDGALLNNIPTTAMREMKPDIVIAVDVGTPLGDMKTISSFFGIVQQSLTVMTIENDRRNLRLADIIIAPELNNLGLLDFSAIDKTADLGAAAAAEKAVVLEKFALGELDWREHLAAREARMRKAAPVPTALEIAGARSTDEDLIREKVEGMVGKPLDPVKLEPELTKVTGLGRYDSLGYGIGPSKRDPSVTVLTIRAKEKAYAPPTMNFALEIDGSDVNDINFTVGSRLTLYDVGGYGGEVRADVKLGFRTQFGLEYYRPLGGHGWFFAPRAAYRRERQNVFSADRRVAEYQGNQGGIGFDLGYTGSRHEWRFGYEFGRSTARVRAGDPSFFPDFRGRYGVARARFAFDGQDSGTVPSRGVRLTAEGRWFFDYPGAPQSYPQVEAKFSGFKPFRENGSLFLIAAGGSSFNRTAGPAQQFVVGGPFRLGAYDREEFRGSHYFLGTVGYLKNVSQLPPLLGGKVYAGGWYDIGGAFADVLNPRHRQGLSGGFVIDTKLGPFSLVGSVGEGGRGKIYFAFGKFF